MMPQNITNAIATTPTPCDRQTFLLTERERHVIAALLAWESRYFVSAEEILEVVSVGETAWVALSRNRTVPVSASTLSLIRRTTDQGASL